MINWQRAWLRKPSLPALILEGERVIVRPPHAQDWHAWVDVRTRDQAHLKPFEPRWPENCLSRDFFMKRIARQARDWRMNASRSFLIFERATGALIGGVNINNLTLGASCHGALGYWIAREYEGQGLMREALSCVLRYGFEGVSLQRMNAACVPENERSAQLLARLGFQEEGFAESYMQINGVWRDHRLFGLTRARYQACPVSEDKAAGEMPSAA